MMPHILIGLGQNWFTQWLNTSFPQSTISPNFHHWRPMVCGQLSKVNRMYLKIQQLQPFSWGRWLTHFGWIGVANCCMLSFKNSILCNLHAVIPRVSFIRVYDIQMCIIVNVFSISVLKCIYGLLVLVYFDMVAATLVTGYSNPFKIGNINISCIWTGRIIACGLGSRWQTRVNMNSSMVLTIRVSKGAPWLQHSFLSLLVRTGLN